jgi:uncharacterized protein (TIGR00369 family)
MSDTIPAGFEPHRRKSGLTAPWEPIYARKTADAVQLGLRASEAHANSRGLVHGGLITSLADNAMGLSCLEQLGGEASLVTLSLTVDFIGTARRGQWLEIRPQVLRAGLGHAFCAASVHADDILCARTSAVFRAARREAA